MKHKYQTLEIPESVQTSVMIAHVLGDQICDLEVGLLDVISVGNSPYIPAHNPKA